MTGNLIKGISASSGIAIGKAYVLDRNFFCVLHQTIDEGGIDDEIEKFHHAVDISINEMEEIKDKAQQEFGGDLPIMIFDAHAQILNDPTIRQDVERIIFAEKCNAEWALKALLDDYHSRFSKIKDVYFRERLQDIEQVITRIQRNLIHGEDDEQALLEDFFILVAHDLNPFDTLQLDHDKIIGIATDAGGKTSHAGILAASMDIPAVLGLKTISMMVRTGEPLIVDGDTGQVIHSPTNEQFIEYNSRRQKYLFYDKELQSQIHLESKTLDGVNVRVMANIESSGDLESAREHGAEGVGLYRTEYLFINNRGYPDEETQFEDYRKVAQMTSTGSAVIRTLDLGGDKLGDFDDRIEPEANPALGLRAIRFCLSNGDIFKTQLRAILRASAFGPIKLMYPLITTLDELLEANEHVEAAKDELRTEGADFNEAIPIGIMIETPASVMIAPELAKHCSFFSIGTNDLIQYTMAIDRVNEKVAYLYQPLSPSILRMLAQIVAAADEAEIGISVCGQMAGDPVYAMLLAGLGNVRELSMDVHSIPRIKKLIRSISIADARTIAAHALSLGTTAEIKEYILKEMRRFMVEGVSSDLLGDET